LKICDIRSREVVYRVRLSDNQGHFEVWLVAQRFGFDAKTDVPAVMEGFRRGKLMLMPRGGAAALIDSSDPKALSNRERRVSCFLLLPIKSRWITSRGATFA
jgi:sacsin